VFLSISTPSLSLEASPSSSGLPEITLQETRKTYHKFAEIVEPPREGYVLTLKLNFSGLTRPKDRAKAIDRVSRLQSVVLSSQLRDVLGRLETTMRLVYNDQQREPFFVSKTVCERTKRNKIFIPDGTLTNDVCCCGLAGFWQDTRRVPHAFQGRHGPGHRDILLPGRWLRIALALISRLRVRSHCCRVECRSCRTLGTRSRRRPSAAGPRSRRRSCAGRTCSTSPPTAASSPSARASPPFLLHLCLSVCDGPVSHPLHLQACCRGT
jgi:hypothetical protein